MLSGFHKLYLTCLKYNFSFVLDSEEYKNRNLKIYLKPDECKKHYLYVVGKNYRELFKNAILRIKEYRAGGDKIPTKRGRE